VTTARAAPRLPSGEALAAWTATLLALALLQLLAAALPLLGQLVGALAVGAFLWVPTRLIERRGGEAADAGFRFDQAGRDLVWALGACALVLPLFTAGFLWFTRALPALPAWARGTLAPYLSARGPLHLPWPAASGARLDLLGRIGGNAAVALAEEFFYRGYLTAAFEQRWPPRRALLGVKLGRGALFANLLFAAGHLLVLAPWRLATFFPGLLFAWLRGRTGTVVSAATCHFVCNVWLLLLELAAY
jgi:membrane protease YdiL (CAAX protease family)